MAQERIKVSEAIHLSAEMLDQQQIDCRSLVGVHKGLGDWK